ncbi:hypothetical protein GA0115259_105096 [Streptomyces sp. MnatMP-M17]|nr:hypothetical protein GA0115259_105096 [Streptomyces sp. MnatMP-M17]
MTRGPVAWLSRFAGLLLIIAIAASCGFMVGVAVSTSPAGP